MNAATQALITAAAAALLAAPILAQQGGGLLPAECREEIIAVCGSDRANLRNCLRDKADDLPRGCAAVLRERAGRNAGAGAMAQYASARVSSTVIYGAHHRQQVDLYIPDDAVGDAALVVFVHGGGWSAGDRSRVHAKPQHFKDAGYVFAAIGYRLLPEAPVEMQAADIGAALRALRAQADAGGFDPDRIVVIGHSSGAHLAALVATDSQYAGDAFGAIRGVVLLDGAGYDVPRAVATRTMEQPLLYRDVFGSDPARQRALSPIAHVGGTDAPHWLTLYVAERAPSAAQAQAFVAALTAAGAQTEALAISGTDHARLNRDIGTEAGAAQTQAVDAFLAHVLD